MSVFRLSGDKPGAQLKLDTRADAEPHLRPLVESRDFVEVHFGGHTLGVGACEAVADALKTQKGLKVRAPPSLSDAALTPRRRSSTWPTSSPRD